MTAANAKIEASKAEAAGASLGVPDWHAIDWHAVNRTVRRLQARIVKATQAEKWGKVRALQHLLTHSFSGKALAVRRVTENQGKHTPGVDKSTWNTPHKKINAVYSLRQSPTASAHLYPQEKRQEASVRYSLHEGPSDASPVLTRS